MLAIAKSFAQRFILLASGLVSKGTLGGGSLDDGFGSILLGTLLGAFCGLLFGLMLTHLVRYFYFLMGRHVTGNACTLISVVVGAALFALWAALGDAESPAVPSIEGIAEN